MPVNPLTRRDFLQRASAAMLASAAAAEAAAATQDVAAPAGNVPLAPPDKQPPDLDVPEPPGRKVGWAIVGLGTLALDEVMPAFALAQRSRPVALVSGHRDKAVKVAAAYGVAEKSIYDYDGFDRIADDPTIEVVYNILPNHMHAEYTIRALRAGKHVLCEKPLAATVDEARQMCDAARETGRKLMTAYRLRYEPYNQKAIELARDEQQFGPIVLFESQNNQDVTPPNIRLSKQTAGGPLGDVGVYCINASRYILGEDPIEAFGMFNQPADDPRFAEVPASVAWVLRFPSGALASCSCGFDGAESRRYRATCREGWIAMDPAFPYRGLRLFTRRGQEQVEHRLREVNQFAAEMDHLGGCVIENRNPLTPGEDGLTDMIVMDAIHRSAAEGRAVKVEGRPT